MGPEAGALPTEPVLSLAIESHASNGRVRIVIAGRINGDHVADAFIRLYQERPEAAKYDRLFDLTRYGSGFEIRHLQRIAPAYRAANPDAGFPCRTAFVTRDPNFDLWAKSMGFQFQGREFRVFATSEAAERYLDEPVANRPPAVA